MTRRAAAVLALAVLALPAAEAAPGRLPSPGLAARQAGTGETIVQVRVQGNRLMSDDEVVALAGIGVGDPFLPSTLDDVRARLAAADRFDDVAVLKRFASFSDTSRVVVVIVIDDRAVRVIPSEVPGGAARVVPRRGPDNLMVLPRIGAEDGYGLTYGAEVALVGVGGDRGRLAVPLTWGGQRRAGVIFTRELDTGPFSRIETGAVFERRQNPSVGVGDLRRRVWGTVERRMGPISVEGTAEYAHVEFGVIEESLASVGAVATFDTRTDPAFPRNAVLLRAGIGQVWFPGRPGRLQQGQVDLRGYLGLAGQAVLVARAERHAASAPQPAYLQPLVGGWSTLRGFAAGTFRGDQASSGSLELRQPLSPVLSAARAGVSVFVDTGAVQVHGQPFGRQRFHTGAGLGVWLTAPGFRVGLSVAHGRGAGTRLNFGGGVGF